VVQRHLLYLGEINSSQAVAWRRVLIPLDVAHHSGMISPTVPI